MTHFMKVYFHTCQNMFTAYFRKMRSFEMLFFSNFRFQHVFQQLFKHIQEKNGPFILFWVRDSRIIIVTLWPSFESVCKHKFISRRITITYTRSAVCTTQKSKLCEKFHGHHMLSLYLSISISLSLSLSLSLSRRGSRKF